MGSIVVCGSGVIGLATALMLTRDGHQVTVLEADPAEVPATPGEAWESWQRKGVTQFRQPHILLGRFRDVCDEELPEITDRMLAAGCVWWDPMRMLPPWISDREPRPVDDALRSVTGRRAVVEYVFAKAAAEQAGLVIRRGERVTELIAGPSAVPGIPHVSGVRLAGGGELRADLVVDAMGRQSRSVELLTSLGTREPFVEAEDAGFVYYTRYFTGPARPEWIGPPIVPLGSFTLLTVDGDNDTWSVTIFAATGDAVLRSLREPERFHRLVQSCPLHAHWLNGTPITEVLAMAGVLNRYRRFAVDGQPLATGYAAVGDSWACSNPSGGRGMTVGLMHAQLLRRVVREHLSDPATLAVAWDEGTEQQVAPYYWDQAAADRERLAEMTAIREGRPWAPAVTDISRIGLAAPFNADAFRAFFEALTCLALPRDLIKRPGIEDAIEELGDIAMPGALGPDRQQLLELLST